jgi:hypothetical protein
VQQRTIGAYLTAHLFHTTTKTVLFEKIKESMPVAIAPPLSHPYFSPAKYISSDKTLC